MILGTCASYGRYQDSVLLKNLRKQAKTYSVRHRFVLADAGFDGRQIETGDVILPVRRHGKLVIQTALNVPIWLPRRNWMAYMGSVGSVRPSI
jgi:hypothetical protein